MATENRWVETQTCALVRKALSSIPDRTALSLSNSNRSIHISFVAAAAVAAAHTLRCVSPIAKNARCEAEAAVVVAVLVPEFLLHQ
jgi:hypothetical protein